VPACGPDSTVADAVLSRRQVLVLVLVLEA